MSKIMTKSIDRLRDISKKGFLKNYSKPQKSVLIEELTKDRNAFEKRILDYIQEKTDEQTIPLYNNKSTKGKQNSAMSATKMKMSDYIDLIKTHPTDLRMFFYDLKMKLPVLFFEGEGSKVLTHFENLMQKSMGQKRVDFKENRMYQKTNQRLENRIL